jgi:hypothetical protein
MACSERQVHTPECSDSQHDGLNKPEYHRYDKLFALAELLAVTLAT